MLASIPILTGSKLRHEKTPPALCQMHNAGGIPVSSDLIFSRQGTVHKVALFILRSRENSVHSVEKLTVLASARKTTGGSTEIAN